MGRKKSSEIEQDLSSFMAVLIMTIGCLVVLLVSNVIVIVSNPENLQIKSIIKASLEEVQLGLTQLFPHGNKMKEPYYVEVYRDRIIVNPGEENEDIVPVRDLELEGNAFESLVDNVTETKDRNYIVLLIRPRSAVVARRLKKAIKQREIDVGFELFDPDQQVLPEEQ